MAYKAEIGGTIYVSPEMADDMRLLGELVQSYFGKWFGSFMNEELNSAIRGTGTETPSGIRFAR